MITQEGADYLTNAGFLGGSQNTHWYIGLLESYRPVAANDTLATLLHDCVESTAYSTTNGLRIPFDGALNSGIFENSAAVATALFIRGATIVGAFITSSPAQGSTSGTLISIEPSLEKYMSAGDILRIAAAIDTFIL